MNIEQYRELIPGQDVWQEGDEYYWGHPLEEGWYTVSKTTNVFGDLVLSKGRRPLRQSSEAT